MQSKISAVNLHKTYKLNLSCIQGLARDILGMIGNKSCVELELVFMDDKSIKKFSKKYRREDKATDVLSFTIETGEAGRKGFIGEIMISLDTALINSKRFGTNLTDEITLYIIHGILHLFGYDDECPEDSRKMVTKQNGILYKLCSCRNLSEVLTPQ